MAGVSTPVDVYFDPRVSVRVDRARWLLEVEKRRDVELRFHLMSLQMLNENRDVDPGYLANTVRSCGPCGAFRRGSVAGSVHGVRECHLRPLAVPAAG